MNEKHYQEKLSAFLNHELPNDERQAIAAHLLQCADCRTEHDRIEFGAALAARLKRSDAPADVWNKIEIALDGKTQLQNFTPARVSFINPRGLLTTAAVAALLIFAVWRRRFISAG